MPAVESQDGHGFSIRIAAVSIFNQLRRGSSLPDIVASAFDDYRSFKNEQENPNGAHWLTTGEAVVDEKGQQDIVFKHGKSLRMMLDDFINIQNTEEGRAKAIFQKDQGLALIESVHSLGKDQQLINFVPNGSRVEDGLGAQSFRRIGGTSKLKIDNVLLPKGTTEEDAKELLTGLTDRNRQIITLRPDNSSIFFQAVKGEAFDPRLTLPDVVFQTREKSLLERQIKEGIVLSRQMIIDNRIFFPNFNHQRTDIVRDFFSPFPLASQVESLDTQSFSVISALDFPLMVPAIIQTAKTLEKVEKSPVLATVESIKPIEIEEPEKPKHLSSQLPEPLPATAIIEKDKPKVLPLGSLGRPEITNQEKKEPFLEEGVKLAHSRSVRVIASGLVAAVYESSRLVGLEQRPRKDTALPVNIRARKENEREENERETRKASASNKRKPSWSWSLARSKTKGVYQLPAPLPGREGQVGQKEKRRKGTIPPPLTVRIRQPRLEIPIRPPTQNTARKTEPEVITIEAFSQIRPHLKISLRKEERPKKTLRIAVPAGNVYLRRTIITTKVEKEQHNIGPAGFTNGKTKERVLPKVAVTESIVFNSVSKVKPASQEKTAIVEKPKEKLSKPKAIEKKPNTLSVSVMLEDKPKGSMNIESNETQGINWEIFLRPVAVVSEGVVREVDEMKLPKPKVVDIETEASENLPIFWELEPVSEQNQGLKPTFLILFSFYLSLIYSFIDKQLIPAVLHCLKIITVNAMRDADNQPMDDTRPFLVSEPGSVAY